MDDRKKTWKKYMQKLMSVENEWSDSIDGSKEREELRLKRCGNRGRSRKQVDHLGLL